MQINEGFTWRDGCRSLGAARRPFGDGSLPPSLQAQIPHSYGVLAFDEFTVETFPLRCLFYLTNWESERSPNRLRQAESESPVRAKNTFRRAAPVAKPEARTIASIGISGSPSIWKTRVILTVMISSRIE